LPAAGAPADAAPAPGPGRAIRLLLVEDHADTARYLSRMLRTKGFEVRVAGDVASAIRAAEAGSFDLVISDLGLPDGTGYDLMRQLRNMGIARGIALSGYGMEEDVLKSRQAGFCEHLVKPLSYDLLLQAIGRTCTGHSAAHPDDA